MHYKRIILYSVIFSLTIFNLYCQDLLNYSNSLKYANYLFKNQQYKLSIIEYERVTYLSPNDTLAILRLIQSYRLLNDFDRAKSRLDLFLAGNLTLCPEEFAVEYFRILFQNQQYTNAYQFLQENKTIEQYKSIEYQLGALLMQNKWYEAKSLAEEFLHYTQKPPKFNNLYNITLQGLNIKYKNPSCAALFSSIIPGSGKLYSNHWKDAIFSFLFVSASSWLTYRSVDQNGINFKSIAFGSIAIGFYSANIYGSYKSAGEYNKKVCRDATIDVERILFDDYSIDINPDKF